MQFERLYASFGTRSPPVEKIYCLVFRTIPLKLTSCHSKTQSFNLLLFERLRFMNSAHSGISTSNLDSRKAYISCNQFKMTQEINPYSVKVLALNFVFHNFSAPIVVWRPLKIFGEGAWSTACPLPPASTPLLLTTF